MDNLEHRFRKQFWRLKGWYLTSNATVKRPKKDDYDKCLSFLKSAIEEAEKRGFEKGWKRVVRKAMKEVITV